MCVCVGNMKQIPKYVDADVQNYAVYIKRSKNPVVFMIIMLWPTQHEMFMHHIISYRTHSTSAIYCGVCFSTIHLNATKRDGKKVAICQVEVHETACESLCCHLIMQFYFIWFCFRAIFT